MGESALKDKAAKGLFWGGLSNGVQQLLGLLFGIFLARLLSPGDYGLVGMLSIFSALAAVLQDGGFALALINKKEVRREDYDSVFWFNVIVSVACYVLLFFCAPLIARFFRQPELVRLARWSFLGIVISSFSTAQSAYLVKNLRIKERAISNMLALAISGMVGVFLAFKGYAYWAIVIQTLVLVTILAICYWCFSPWRPSLSWSLRPIKEMFRFGFKVLITNATESMGTYLFSVVFGRYYSKHEVGFFNQANKWNTMGYSVIKGMMAGVAQPVLVEVNDERQRHLRVFRKLVRVTAFLSFPAMLGLAFIAPEFITVAITDKWATSAGLMQILCVGGAFIPLSYLFSNLVLSLERSSAYMWSNIALLGALILMTILIYPLGIQAMVLGYTLVNILWLLVWFFLSHRDIGYSFLQMMTDVLPFLGLTVIALTAAFLLTRHIGNIYFLLIAKILVTAAIYALLMWVTRSVTFKESIEFLLKRKMTA